MPRVAPSLCPGSKPPRARRLQLQVCAERHGCKRRVRQQGAPAAAGGAVWARAQAELAAVAAEADTAAAGVAIAAALSVQPQPTLLLPPLLLLLLPLPCLTVPCCLSPPTTHPPTYPLPPLPQMDWDDFCQDPLLAGELCRRQPRCCPFGPLFAWSHVIDQARCMTTLDGG